MPTLLDGTEVASDSEEWRHLCEANAIVNFPTLAARRAQLDLVEKRRGEAERLRLEKTIMALWRQRRQQ